MASSSYASDCDPRTRRTGRAGGENRPRSGSGTGGSPDPCRWVLIGLLGGSRSEIDLGMLVRRRITLVGSTLRSRPLDEKGVLTDEFRQQVLPLLVCGKVRPVLDRILPIGAVQEAHQVMEENQNFGKIVLRMDGWKGN